MSHLPVHPSKRHPLTGALLRAVGVLPNGRVVWPILGGDDTNVPVDRPDDITTEEWDALGDPGKRALVREREARTTAEAALAASRARPGPRQKAAEEQTKGADAGGATDFTALVHEAVAAAIKPFQERDAARDAETAAEKVRGSVVEAAKSRLLDPSDSLQIDLASVLDDKGVADPAKVTAALDALVRAKPHLAKSERRFAPVGIGGGAAVNGAAEKDAVAAALARMQQSTGIRVPTA